MSSDLPRHSGRAGIAARCAATAVSTAHSVTTLSPEPTRASRPARLIDPPARRWYTPGVPRLGVPKYDWWNESLHGVARAGESALQRVQRKQHDASMARALRDVLKKKGRK